MQLFARRLALALAATGFLLSSSSGQNVLTVSWDGTVALTDPATGDVVYSVAGGVSYLNSLARASDGTLYTVGGAALCTVDPLTGAVAVGPALAINVTALAPAPNDQLYAIVKVGQPADYLARIDPATGSVTPIGSTGLDCVQALAFDGNELFAWCDGLARVDPATGAATLINLTFPVLNVQSLWFDAAGDLWGGRNHVARIDVDTGVQTIVAKNLFDDARGVEIVVSTLFSTTDSISLASGGQQALALAGGGENAGAAYLVLGSLSGTSPGFALDGLVLPLNIDGYTVFTLASPNVPPLSSTFGTLDALGNAQAAFTLPPFAFPILAGAQANHAGLIVSAPQGIPLVTDVTNALPLDFLP